MTPTPDLEAAMERARRAQEDRLATVRSAVLARQQMADALASADAERSQLEERLRGMIALAEERDVAAYNAARRVGWTVGELRDIGLTEPAKKTRTRKRASAAKRKPSNTQNATPNEDRPVINTDQSDNGEEQS